MEYNVEVKLLAMTPDAENLAEQAGRLCYASGSKQGSSQDWLQTRIKQGHESLIEHVSATFYIKASRVVTHELVRHRIGSYSQRSQRYVKENQAEFITPPEIAEGNDAKLELFKEAMANAWDSYRKLLEAGIKAEIARYVLPNACTTEIICTWNFRELRHILKLRTAPSAQPEMRAVADRIKEILKTKAPKIFGDL
ncbi:MAG: thymidylate synthase [Dehalococcoides mccartyi]|uniref:FAD-dependent thymidylate synthase n=1 Tax=Dehalococcoides mccartyi TaxID=61435 RepID=UPI0004E054A5|nr:FAD-dependent thymidylate synthase [Dehalococcoides mccartyi]AII60010.1 thymidylate synthase [Dehalococcoides mccartyi CG4]AQU03676.1 thymidylate synthase (FAD) [Dehalococcoides mccartyi]AQU04976.1 thymidylate synthase (FAD) [Dehalococcoides mccartyi]MCF7635976.1 thymidylate synthase [Dehalococcoides mccartyi]MEA2121161.1 Flavin-dependent thymidylate synthase [Dehalococcoides mccartyi]